MNEITEQFDITDFLEIEHSDEARAEAQERAALILPWSR